MRLGHDDFCRLTPDEFTAVADAWREHDDLLRREEWERMRLLATITIQPHVRRKLKASELLPFPWEKETQWANRPAAPRMTRTEQLARMEEVMRRLEGQG